ncbi:MAG: stage IV sporulation protein A [Clostridia bacterium]|nr:stage IV sporulation protein A [Clostridia bacterium]
MVTSQSIYKDIATRTGGQIHIGVVGPVRSGKSTFIRRFMEELVLPGIEDDFEKSRAADEMPQSAGGRTVMTTEPKFIPDEAVEVTLSDDTKAKIKLIDCVGYLIPDIIGDTENGEVRLVQTPWFDKPIPFDKAAEIGTEKVIKEHSTIGILVTSDGTVGDIPRENFIEAEERCVRELKEIGKPFVLILNSSKPESTESEALAVELENKYSVPTALLSCQDLESDDIAAIMKLIIPEFPLRELTVSMPPWISVLDEDHKIKRIIAACLKSSAEGIKRMGDVKAFRKALASEIASGLGVNDADVSSEQISISPGNGSAEIKFKLPDGMFFKTIGELTGIDIKDEATLLTTLRNLSEIKKEYDKYTSAIDDVLDRGYGIVMPDMDDMKLDEPEIVRQTGGFGIRLRASAPSIHMIKADIETELNPMVGTEQQSEELVKYLLAEFDEDPRGLWNTNLFGKSIYELVCEGLHSKLDHMPEDARERFGETLSKVINEGASGVICILL